MGAAPVVNFVDEVFGMGFSVAALAIEAGDVFILRRETVFHCGGLEGNRKVAEFGSWWHNGEMVYGL